MVTDAATGEIRQGEGRRTKLQINTTRSKAERGLDAYFTPPAPIWSLLALEAVPHCIWEPAAGDGAIVRVLEAAGHLVVAWLWLEQALATGSAAGDFHEGKRQAARFFWRWELPRVHHRFDLLASLDRTVLDTPERWL